MSSTRRIVEAGLLVGAGGFLGSVLRYSANVLIARLAGNPPFPWATLGVNVTGCFLIGVAAGMIEAREALPGGFRIFFMVGLLGGLTTFSAFGFETVELLETGRRPMAFWNVALNLFLGLSAVWAGNLLGRLAW